MTNWAGRLEGWRSTGAGVIVTAALLLAVLVVQHLRHGWPFSLHHGFQPDSRSSAEMPRPQAMPEGTASHTQHPRASVELDPLGLESIALRLDSASIETISQSIRAVATVVPDESRVSHVHTRVAGWIEQLHVSTTGQSVRAGQPLAGIFSQDLFSSQAEYLSARRQAATGPRSVVAESARTRLNVLGMTEAEIRGIEERGEPRRLVTVVAPRSGVVLHRGVSVGTAVDPSTEIVTVADLSRVWVFAEVPEPDIPQLQKGTSATIEIAASGRPPFEARVEFLYPTLTERTRTLRVRFVADNRDGSLRPGLFGTAEFEVAPRQAITVPRDAVVDTGSERHVFVAVGPGRFEPRTVSLGVRLTDRVEVVSGLSEGERVVSSGVFLIDSESRLRASGGAGTSHGSHGPASSENRGGSSHEGH